MPLGTEVGLGPGDIVRWGHSSPPKKGHSPPNFSVYIYCGQTAGWIKMPLSTKVGLGPGHIVLDEYPAPPKRGTAHNFRLISIVAKRSPISATAEHFYMAALWNTACHCIFALWFLLLSFFPRLI